MPVRPRFYDDTLLPLKNNAKWSLSPTRNRVCGCVTPCRSSSKPRQTVDPQRRLLVAKPDLRSGFCCCRLETACRYRVPRRDSSGAAVCLPGGSTSGAAAADANGHPASDLCFLSFGLRPLFHQPHPHHCAHPSRHPLISPLVHLVPPRRDSLRDCTKQGQPRCEERLCHCALGLNGALNALREQMRCRGPVGNTCLARLLAVPGRAKGTRQTAE